MLMACNDDIYLSSDSAVGHAMRFEVTVEDQPQTRGEVLNVNDNEVTRDFKKVARSGFSSSTVTAIL